ncbi:ribosomal large subunit pseudouridine synthase A [Mariprofundus ferrinatatus]|uniref:Ribosomal large subunit pseudouridine synthase A n=1 Tax=Mariprofundus ferrinatatus TaxID=1921087 RepID=A0A2K8L594_9PROT|nr:RluA family pseudouridine synthase [Mariprofundus ferrinatatus]ATX82282.1 ribosomal large subunit pseudouridine synthase A [Mariprofundus ferrinatatus]
MKNAGRNKLISLFPTPPAAGDVPEVMPSPFSSRPHPLARHAALLLQQQLATESCWPGGYSPQLHGKMFGVLVVRDVDGAIGYLSAFSGMMGGRWQHPGFVPQLFELAGEDSALSFGNRQLAELTEELKKLEASEEHATLVREVALLQQQRDMALSELRQRHIRAREARKSERQALAALPEAERLAKMEALALASQHHKREATNTRAKWDKSVQQLQQPLDAIEQRIREIKDQRSELSRRLHQQFFESYLLNNPLHEEKAITHFFADATPPAGAGDCAGPKLLHYAHCHQMQPLAMAEFWWGASPSSGVRHHGQFYPACRGKCRPILPFMLRGLKVEPEPCYGQNIDADEPEIVYEDETLLVINKPAGLMSAPGMEIKDSVYHRLQQRYPDNPELRLVHRLDMATSGLLLVAKNLCINKSLQRQFIQRSVEKRYEALLSRPLSGHSEGMIELPLRVDFDDRPRQLVCFEYGKPATTRWQVIRREGETTRIWFYPHTGRTHQLRVHASHRDGLNAAIVGDELYGEAGERLMLHAQRLSFIHPLSQKRMAFELPAPF